MQRSVEIPLNLVVASEGANVTVKELLPASFEVGDEIPQTLLDTPAYEDLKQVIDDNTYSYWCVPAAPALARVKDQPASSNCDVAACYGWRCAHLPPVFTLRVCW